MPHVRRNEHSSLVETGQALVLVALMLPVLLGFLGLTIDFGRLAAERRKLQSDADAAALAGAQDLSLYYQNAVGDAQNSLTANGFGSGRPNDTVLVNQVATTNFPNDTMQVQLSRKVSLDFMPVLGIGSETVKAGAQAIAASVAGCVDTQTSKCAPYTAWRPGPACGGNYSEFEVGLVVVFRSNGWVDGTPGQDGTGAGSCPGQWTIPANDYKGFLRPINSDITVGTDSITTHGGNACGQEPVQNIQNAWAANQRLVIPVVDLGAAGQGSGNPNIHIPGFITISLNFTFPYPGTIQSVSLNGAASGSVYQLTFNGSSTPATSSATQTITVNGIPTGGSFTLSYGGKTTSPITYPTTAAAIQSALQAIPAIDDATVSGTGPYTVNLNIGGATPGAISVNDSGLTGGINMSIAIGGVALTPEANSATVQAALAALQSIGAGNVAVTANGDSSYTVNFLGSLATQSEPAMTVSPGTSPILVTLTATNPGEEGDATSSSDYLCPGTWYGKVVSVDTGAGAVGGIAGGGNGSQCDSTFFTCSVRLENYP